MAVHPKEAISPDRGGGLLTRPDGDLLCLTGRWGAVVCWKLGLVPFFSIYLFARRPSSEESRVPMAWDSLRAHNGCLSLFDMDDLATGVRRMSLKDIKPRNFQFRRVASAGPAQSSVSAGTAARVLLPSLECEEDTDAASHGDSQGVFLLVQSDSKVSRGS